MTCQQAPCQKSLKRYINMSMKFTPINELTNEQLMDTITPNQAAEMLGIKPNTLAAWRSRGTGKLPYMVVGGGERGPIKYFRIHIFQRKRMDIKGL